MTISPGQSCADICAVFCWQKSPEAATRTKNWSAWKCGRLEKCMTSLEECSNNSTLGSTLPRTMKGKPQTEKQRGQGACAKQRLHQRGHEGASWRSCGGQGRTLEAVDHSCDSWKLLQGFTSHRLRARSGNARSMEEACRYKEARRATREQVAPMGAPGPTGETRACGCSPRIRRCRAKAATVQSS